MEQRDFEAAQAIVLSTYKFQKWQLLDNLDFFCIQGYNDNKNFSRRDYDYGNY